MEQIVDRILRFNDTLAEIDISITSLPGILLSKQLTETPGSVILSIKYAKSEFFAQHIPDNVLCKQADDMHVIITKDSVRIISKALLDIVNPMEAKDYYDMLPDEILAIVDALEYYTVHRLIDCNGANIELLGLEPMTFGIYAYKACESYPAKLDDSIFLKFEDMKEITKVHSRPDIFIIKQSTDNAKYSAKIVNCNKDNAISDSKVLMILGHDELNGTGLLIHDKEISILPNNVLAILSKNVQELGWRKALSYAEVIKLTLKSKDLDITIVKTTCQLSVDSNSVKDTLTINRYRLGFEDKEVKEVKEVKEGQATNGFEKIPENMLEIDANGRIKEFEQMHSLIDELANTVFKTANNNGHYQSNPDPASLLMHIVAEVAESAEAIIVGRSAHEPLLDLLSNNWHLETFEKTIKNTSGDEIADIIILALSIAKYKKIPIAKHMVLKMLYNEHRHKHSNITRSYSQAISNNQYE